jgi:hypothetical protein
LANVLNTKSCETGLSETDFCLNEGRLIFSASHVNAIRDADVLIKEVVFECQRDSESS